MNRSKTRDLFGSIMVSIFIMLPFIIHGAGKPEEEPAKVEAKATVDIHQAPILAKLVEAGELEPLAERLPEDPLVVDVTEEIGQYGGTMELFLTTTRPGWEMAYMGNEVLFRLSPEGTLIPNIAKSYRTTDDGLSYIITFRKGMRWSDGHPFSIDDLLFYFEDVVLNKELSPNIHTRWKSPTGEPAKFEKLDETTLKISYAVPNGLLLQNLQYSSAGVKMFTPRHYLEQFHAKYARKEDLDKLVKEAGLESWTQLFWKKNDNYIYANPDMPVLYAWVLKTEPPSNRYILERNPYYWKVDTEGNQLPYIDRVALNTGNDKEVITLKAISGESSAEWRTTILADYSLYKENEAKGDYRVLMWLFDGKTAVNIEPNLNVADEVLRVLNNDIRFRKALSFAFNRDEINEIVFQGLGTPRQATPMEESRYYVKGYDKLYIEYDSDKANRLLDELDLKWDANHKFRLRPDGKTLSLLFQMTSNIPYAEEIMPFLKVYLAEIGIDVDWRVVDTSTFRNRIYANEVDISLTQGRSGLYPYGLFPWAANVINTYWATEYGRWYATQGAEGIEPPPGDIRRLQELASAIVYSTDEEKQTEHFMEIFKLHSENLWIIGTIGQTPKPIIVQNNLRNIPEKGIYSGAVGNYMGNKMMEQFFFKKEE